MCMLSVIVPVFNSEDWLKECAESILHSAKGGNIELLLIDDGSTDSSGIICDSICEGRPNVRVLHKENGGVSSARNEGLSLAKGEYIAWVDADDYVAEGWFGAIESAIAQGKPDVIVFDSARVFPEETIPEIYGRESGKLDIRLFKEDVMRDARMLSGLPNKVIKRSLFHGVEFDTSLKILEDFAAMPHILSNAESAWYIAEILYFYRQQESSLLHAVSSETAYASFKTALLRGEDIKEQFPRAAVTAAAKQAFCFCWNKANLPDFGAHKSQTAEVKKFLRRNALSILSDGEIPFKTRIQMIYYGIFA